MKAGCEDEVRPGMERAHAVSDMLRALNSPCECVCVSGEGHTLLQQPDWAIVSSKLGKKITTKAVTGLLLFTWAGP